MNTSPIRLTYVVYSFISFSIRLVYVQIEDLPVFVVQLQVHYVLEKVFICRCELAQTF